MCALRQAGGGEILTVLFVILSFDTIIVAFNKTLILPMLKIYKGTIVASSFMDPILFLMLPAVLFFLAAYFWKQDEKARK